MDGAPSSVSEVIFIWTVFAFFSAVSLALGLSRAMRIAFELDEQDKTRRKPNTIGHKRIVNLTLAFYMMTMYYMIMIFIVMMMYGGLTVLHVGLDALFRGSAYWLRMPSIQRAMGTMDWITSPGVTFGFLSVRMWGVHLLVLLALLAVVVIYNLTVVQKKTVNTRKKDEYKPSSAFAKTIQVAVYPMFWTLYATVVVREMLRVVESD
jgi:hypothetical protein